MHSLSTISGLLSSPGQVVSVLSVYHGSEKPTVRSVERCGQYHTLVDRMMLLPRERQEKRSLPGFKRRRLFKLVKLLVIQELRLPIRHTA
jgi:hypothetical protein